MKKRKTGGVSIWEKLSDFFMDTAKYLLTAVIITSVFEELSEIGWSMYLFGILGVTLLLLTSLKMISKANKK